MISYLYDIYIYNTTGFLLAVPAGYVCVILTDVAVLERATTVEVVLVKRPFRDWKTHGEACGATGRWKPQREGSLCVDSDKIHACPRGVEERQISYVKHANGHAHRLLFGRT